MFRHSSLGLIFVFPSFISFAFKESTNINSKGSASNVPTNVEQVAKKPTPSISQHDNNINTTLPQTSLDNLQQSHENRLKNNSNETKSLHAPIKNPNANPPLILRQVQIFFRHGARTPVAPPPGNIAEVNWTSFQRELDCSQQAIVVLIFPQTIFFAINFILLADML